jgi:hypothetical protein
MWYMIYFYKYKLFYLLCLATLMYFNKTIGKIDMERSDGVLGFSKTKFCLEQEKVKLKLANGHTKLHIVCVCCIIRIYNI